MAAADLPLTELGQWLAGLPGTFSPDERRLAGPVLAELDERIQRLAEVGAGYLTAARSTPSLSAGEAQRLRLAALLGSGLSGVLYVFDEPTIGIHPRDTRRMIAVLRRLRDLGNTVLVIEHDLEIITAADYVIDFGPGAGKHGGQVVASGAPAEIMAQPGSLTGDYLAGRLSIPVPASAAPAWPGRPDHPRRPPAQPAGPDGAHSARPAGGRDRRVRLGQILAGVRYPRPGRPPAPVWGWRISRRARRHGRPGAPGQDHHHQPGIHRAYPALERCHLYRHLHPHPQNLRRHARSAPPGPESCATSPSTSRAGAASAARGPAC